MTLKSISTSKDITIETDNNTLCTIEIYTYLGTIVYKDAILPKNKMINIKGLNPGKYIIHISNEFKLTKQQIQIT